VIMESYQVFLLSNFNTVVRTHLCSQVVQNQVMALYGGKAAFQEYVKAHQDKFYSALKDNFQTCCQPEFLLNRGSVRLTLRFNSFSVILTNVPKPITSSQLLCRTSQVARLLSSKTYLRRAHIGIYVGTQEILSSKSNTSSSINRSTHPAVGRRVKSTPTSSFKSVYK